MRNLFAAILIAVPMFANASAWIDPGLEPFAKRLTIRMGRGITMPEFFNRTFALVREPVKPSAPKFEMELNEEDL